MGAELRKRRESAGLTGDDIVHETGWHRSKVSRVELGQAEISVVDAIHYLAACKVFANEAREVLALCRDAERQLGYWLRHGEAVSNSLVYHEATAQGATSYEPMVVPELLQTRCYARTRMEEVTGLSEEACDAALQAQEKRQQVLHQQRPGRFTFFVHENALRLRVGSQQIMHEQLLKLVLLGGLPQVCLRVIPVAAGGKGVIGAPFRLFEHRDHDPLAYFGTAATGVFLDDRDAVVSYRGLVARLDEVAVDERKSRGFVAELADALDEGSRECEAGIYELAEGRAGPVQQVS